MVNSTLGEKGKIFLELAKIINYFFGIDRNVLKKCIEETVQELNLDPEEVVKLVNKLYEELRNDAPNLDKIYLTILVIDYLSKGKGIDEVSKCVDRSLSEL